MLPRSITSHVSPGGFLYTQKKWGFSQIRRFFPIGISLCGPTRGTRSDGKLNLLLISKRLTVLLQEESLNLRSITLLSLIEFTSLSQEWLIRLKAKLLTPHLRSQ